MSLILLKIFINFVVLLFGAERLVVAACSLSSRLGVSQSIVGLTVVALCTSAPEVVVSFIASLEDKPGIGIGNALGSNITNIAMVIGLCALISPRPLKAISMHTDILLLMVLTLVIGYTFIWLGLNPWIGVFCIISGVCYMTWNFLQAQGQHKNNAANEDNSKHHSVKFIVFWMAFSVISIPISSHYLIIASSDLARLMGISELVIGLTIVAIGTSLPELSASLTGLYKKAYGITIGNIIGSNIFNLCFVFAFPCLFASNHSIDPNVYSRDIPVMVLINGFFVLMIFRKKDNTISKVSGALLLLMYFSYIASLFVI